MIFSFLKMSMWIPVACWITLYAGLPIFVAITVHLQGDVYIIFLLFFRVYMAISFRFSFDSPFSFSAATAWLWSAEWTLVSHKTQNARVHNINVNETKWLSFAVSKFILSYIVFREAFSTLRLPPPNGRDDFIFHHKEFRLK